MKSVSITHSARAAILVCWLVLSCSSAVLAQVQPIAFKWLGDAAPGVADGVNFGAPWPKGAVKKSDPITIKGADGKAIAMQSWPLAYWPDGSIKWSGHALAMNGAAPAGPLTMSVGAATAPEHPITVKDDAAAIEVDTGAVRAKFPKSGSYLIESMYVGDRQVAQNGKLIVQAEDRSQQAEGIIKIVGYTSKVTSAKIENGGPLRTVVKVEGMHKADKGDRTWLPFTMRFYFYAGIGSVNMVHSFIYDGDQEKDFIKGMGLSFTVPFKEELHNRHVRFAGDGTGVWCQPVQLIPGYRNALSADEYAQHLAGKRMPNLDSLRSRGPTESVAVYNDMKLTQLGPDSFSIDKRTTDQSSWLHVNNGHRSLGLAVLGDVSGGIAVGVKDFWQKYPASLEISNAASSAGEMKIWLWSPDGDAMDMRTYDTVPHGLATNYEDWKPGWGSAYGVARSTDMTLWAFNEIPSNENLVKMAKLAAAPPVLVASPEYYHSIPVFGRWPLVDKSAPTLVWVEDQLEQLYTYYRDQVEERHWYGFWDFGDVMHNYDFGRHDWRYDVGGWAWANTELMPDMFLWYTFMRTGRPDAFRMAEAMTRHTSEVDSLHIGPFAPMGSRHNVNHWGDGAKQPRASHAMLKRYMYYLTGGDERLGDLMREQLDADLTYSVLQKYNGSHYVPVNGKPVLDGNPEAPGPEALTKEIAAYREASKTQLSDTYKYADGKPIERRYTDVGFTLEWISYSINWMTEWERTGDIVWRDRVLAGMKNIVATSRPQGNYFGIIFGGPEIMYEEQEMFDYPEFWSFFTEIMQSVGDSAGGQMTAPRGAAYAAWMKKNQDLGNLAWDKLVGTAKTTEGEKIPPTTQVSGPEVLNPVHDPNFLGKTNGWQLHGVASVQWALNAMQTLEFAKPYLANWETARKANNSQPVAQPAPAAAGRGNRGAAGGNRAGRGGRGNRGAATAPAAE